MRRDPCALSPRRDRGHARRTFIVDGIEQVVWLDPVYLRSVGGPDTGDRWGVVPLREVTDAEQRSFGQTILFDGFARAVRIGEWLDHSVEDGIATQRILVTADDLALVDTTEEFLGFVSYHDVMDITFVYDRERLLGFTLEYGSADGPVTDETTILRFDGESAIPCRTALSRSLRPCSSAEASCSDRHETVGSFMQSVYHGFSGPISGGGYIAAQ